MTFKDHEKIGSDPTYEIEKRRIVLELLLVHNLWKAQFKVALRLYLNILFIYCIDEFIILKQGSILSDVFNRFRVIFT